MSGLENIVKKGVFFGGLASGMSCNHNGQDTNTNDTGVIDTGEPYECQPQQITSALTATAWVNQEFSYTITVERDTHSSCDIENYYSICDFPNPPVEISDDSGVNGCTMTWIPTQSDYQQTFSFNLKAKDWFGIDEDVLEVYVDRVDNAPVIETTSLPDAIRNSLYNATITATDADGDSLEYSLVSSPSWLTISTTSGELSGTPTEYATESVTVNVSDGELDVSQTYSIAVEPVATLEMYAIDGDDGSAADSSCNIDISLTNTSSGFEETERVDSSGVANFNLDETGTYNISVPSTNTDSNCYGGVEQDEWVDVVAGTNSGWVTLIPESYQDEVVEVVGDQIDMGDIWGHSDGAVDSVTKLVKFMGDVDSIAPYQASWNGSIRNGTEALEVEDFNGFTYQDIDYDTALVDAVGYWEGHLAPSMDIVSADSGGDIYFDLTSNWQAFEDYDYNSTTGVYTISNCEIRYGGCGTYDYAVVTIAHEMGHCIGFRHTSVEGVFVMDSSPNVPPHELELLVARVLNNIGNENPRAYPIDLFNGYLE